MRIEKNPQYSTKKDHEIMVFSLKLNFDHLQQRILQFNNTLMTKEEFIVALKERIATTDIEKVKADVNDFVINPRELDIWSNDYFLQIADMVRFV